MTYVAKSTRYDDMVYERCGNSGLKLPRLSLGLWHNFGESTSFETSREMVRVAFDNGITQFDLANNYGIPGGSAETVFGQILHSDFSAYRDQMIITTKAGYYMWEGPYGEWGSRKYMLSSLDQSLKRMNLDYVDIFYSHRPDPDTPLEETMGALVSAVKSGKALYVGLSNYSPDDTIKATKILADMGVSCLIHQPSYSMLNRHIENGLLDAVEQVGIGMAIFSPLSQGLLTSKYLKTVPADSRAMRDGRFLNPDQITKEKVAMLNKLNGIAKGRGQTLVQMALSWSLRDKRVTTAIIGASRPAQITENLQAVHQTEFSAEELAKIDATIG